MTIMAEALTAAWADIRAQNPDVPEVVIGITPGSGSTCGSVVWSGSPVLLAAISQEAKARDVLAGLLHQAAHGLAGPQSTASEGRYHNAAYRDAAERVGLKVGHDHHGWSQTSLPAATATAYAPTIKSLGAALRKWTPPGSPAQQARTGKSQKRVSIACQCDPPRRVMVVPSVLALGPLRCEICGQAFEPRA